MFPMLSAACLAVLAALASADSFDIIDQTCIKIDSLVAHDPSSGAPDIYVKTTMNGVTRTTSVKDNTDYPDWGDDEIYCTSAALSSVYFEIWDDDSPFSDDLRGSVTVDLAALFASSSTPMRGGTYTNDIPNDQSGTDDLTWSVIVTGETFAPTATPSKSPSPSPSAAPSSVPSASPSVPPSAAPSAAPTQPPSAAPSVAPSANPTANPSSAPSAAPTQPPSSAPSMTPSQAPSNAPSAAPTTVSPTAAPTTQAPSLAPSTEMPSLQPTPQPSSAPTTMAPTRVPSRHPTPSPTKAPVTATPSRNPTTDAPTATPWTCIQIRTVEACDPSWGDPDIYVKTYIKGDTFETSVKDNVEFADFRGNNEVYCYEGRLSSVKFEVWDEDVGADDLRASRTVNLDALFDLSSTPKEGGTFQETMNNIEGCTDVLTWSVTITWGGAGQAVVTGEDDSEEKDDNMLLFIAIGAGALALIFICCFLFVRRRRRKAIAAGIRPRAKSASGVSARRASAGSKQETYGGIHHVQLEEEEDELYVTNTTRGGTATEGAMPSSRAGGEADGMYEEGDIGGEGLEGMVGTGGQLPGERTVGGPDEALEMMVLPTRGGPAITVDRDTDSDSDSPGDLADPDMVVISAGATPGLTLA